MGMTFVRILHMPNVVFWSLIAISLNLVARFLSVLIGTLCMGKLPDHYDKGSFATLLTWGGLRGGLSIALAMSAAQMLDSNVYNIILGGTYAIVFFTTIVQGLTMKRVYLKIEKKVKQNTV
jgi:CPA1 family monovalent cation:H+ antiporter